MKKTITLSILSLIFFLTVSEVNAQRKPAKSAEKIEIIQWVKSESGKAYLSEPLMQDKDGNILFYSRRHKKLLIPTPIFPFYWIEFVKSYDYITTYSPELEYTSENQLGTPIIKSTGLNLFGMAGTGIHKNAWARPIFNDHFMLLPSKGSSRRSRNLSIWEFKAEDYTFEKRVKLGSYDRKKDKISNLYIKPSINKRYYLSSYAINKKKDPNKTIYFSVIDSTGQKVKDGKFKVSGKETDNNYLIDVTDEGNVAVLEEKIFTKKERKQVKKTTKKIKSGGSLDSKDSSNLFSYIIHTQNGSGAIETKPMTLSVGRPTRRIGMKADATDFFLFGSFEPKNPFLSYQNPENYLFTAIMDEKGEIFSEEYPSEEAGELDDKKLKRKDRKNARKKSAPGDYGIIDFTRIEVSDDGSYYIVGQAYKMEARYQWSVGAYASTSTGFSIVPQRQLVFDHYYGNIYALKFNSDGEWLFSKKIPNHHVQTTQSTRPISHYLRYTTLVRDGNLYVTQVKFNNRKEYKATKQRVVFTINKVNHVSGEVTKKIFHSNQKGKNFVISANVVSLDKQKILIHAYSKGWFKSKLFFALENLD